MRIQLRAVFPAIIGLGLAAGLTVATPAWAGAGAPRTAQPTGSQTTSAPWPLSRHPTRGPSGSGTTGPGTSRP